MTGAVSTVGDVINGIADLSGLVADYKNRDWVDGTASAVAFATSMVASLNNHPSLKILAASANVVSFEIHWQNLQSELQKPTNEVDEEALAEAFLGVLGAVGGVLSVLPLGPQVKLAGIALSAFANLGHEVLSGDINQALSDLWKGLVGEGDINPDGSIDFSLAQRIVLRRDPLTLDLDGDGLETASAAASGVLFDHDGDGIATGSGWVGSDDGFLVLDRNSNGTIDTGAELFGDSTPLSGGGTAADGFAALAQEDTNSDGVVNSADTRWNDLRIWRDLNQDGISQSGELFTLGSLGIASINVAATEHSQVLADGNRIADLGTYTRTDSTTGSTGSVGEMADIDLTEDTFHREFTNSIPLVSGVTSLPNMQASGKVRDLWEAASQSTALFSALGSYSAATTRAAQLGQLDALLEEWAATAGMETMEERANNALATQENPYGYGLEWEAIGRESRSVLRWEIQK